MKFKQDTQLYSSEVQAEGGENILYINYLGAPYVPSLADSAEVMGRTVDALIENQNVSRIVFVQQKNYNYDFSETSLLLEIAQLYIYFLKQEAILSQEKLITNNQQVFSQRYNDIFSFLFLLKQDPIASYNELKKLIIESKILLEKLGAQYNVDQENYIYFLEKLFGMVAETKLIKMAIPYMEDYQKGDREIYTHLFKPDTIPNFTFTRLVSDLPENVEIVDKYEISDKEYDKSLVTILRRKDK